MQLAATFLAVSAPRLIGFCRGGSFLEVTGRMLQLGGGAGLVLRLLLARATQGLGGEVRLPH